ncbi:hypothetical protein BJX66DRAFT_316834 [Aspergillus keveii]|uniref:Uncharacterized protein n=1 Tax=Aspergillus keveii TaxID=714993 RepID=A0ABR4FMN7_9EURO
MVIKPLSWCEQKGNWSSSEWEENMNPGDWMDRRVAQIWSMSTIIRLRPLRSSTIL